MALTKSQKEQILSDTSRILKDSDAIIFSDFSGIPVSQLTKLRRSLFSIKAGYKVIKKTLLTLALKKVGRDFDFEKLTGPIGAVFVTGEINEVAKLLYQFSKENEKFKIIGGLDLRENNFLDQELIIALAKLPSKEILLGNFVRTLSMPLRNLIGILEGNLRKLVMALSEIKRS